MGVAQEGVEDTRKARGEAVSPKNRCSAGTGSGIGYRKGLREEGLLALSGHGPITRLPQGTLCLTLGPSCRRSPAHQGPGRCCRRVSRRLRRLRHLGPPAPESLPQAFAESTTWRSRLVAASSGRTTSPKGAYSRLTLCALCCPLSAWS